MAVNLSVKHVPEELAELLQRELLSILEAAVGHAPNTRRTAAGHAPRDAITIEELAKISRRLFPKGTESSVSYLRQQRDRR
jgi:hypothetical protein